MNRTEFIAKIESTWDKTIEPRELRLLYLKKINRFHLDELDLIFDKLVETWSARYPPPIGKIYGAARDLGLFQTVTETRVHSWIPSDCKLCGGEGALSIWFEITQKKNADGEFYKSKRTKRIFPLSSGDQVGIKKGESIYSYVYRCNCSAGENPTLGKWPVWNSNDSVPVYKLEKTPATQKEFSAVSEIIDGARKVQPDPRREDVWEDPFE